MAHKLNFFAYVIFNLRRISCGEKDQMILVAESNFTDSINVNHFSCFQKLEQLKVNDKTFPRG